MKRLEWAGSALDDLREFPQEARNEAGHQLHRVQCAKEPSDWKPMNAIGSGVRELRIHTNREHRVFYVVRFDDAVYVLSAFEKKSQKTKVRTRTWSNEIPIGHCAAPQPQGETMRDKIRRSSGNVFRDLGASDAEAENLRARSLMMIQLVSIIRRQGWTQTQAAKVLAVTQPRVSDLMCGKIDRFSVDSLIELFGRCGMTIAFSARRRTKRVV
jgi:phage-related protein/predicted XRE-type DNA-binding protein